MAPQSVLEYLVENEPSFRKARLPALYSSFQSQRDLNPDGFAANLSAWRRALAKVTSSGLLPSSSTKPDLFVLSCSGEGLLRAFESKQYGRPLALGTVIQEAVAAKDLVPLTQFLEDKDSIYNGRNAAGSWSVRNLAGWALKTLGVSDLLRGSDKIPTEKFVVFENVEGAGRSFGENEAAQEEGRFERTFSKAHFYKVFNGQIVSGKELSETDMEVLLRFLERDKRVIAYDGSTVRIKVPGVQDEGDMITEEDKSIAQLKEVLASLTHQTAILSKRIEELSATAKLAVAKQNRVAALQALKQKKLAEATLEKRFATVNQLEEVATKIQQASDNVAVVRVMESSADALQSLAAKVGGTERVEEVVDRLREQMAATDEIGTILAEASGTTVLDEGEIDDELAAMEREEKEAKEAIERKKKEAKEQKEKERREKEEAKEAEALQRRLEKIGNMPEGVKETESPEAMMGRLTLEEN
ncbi:vacuolar-sorting protein SNF7 [Podospora australis]|uniref:Vacuolar-sorting protein SNF7 n=1 Tax=Podospora australis TaxID=1536484 RepID=A0AAN6WR74_9PEZI|nr:vacuolar-sorting protein SNF7 [Podospora australis]